MAPSGSLYGYSPGFAGTMKLLALMLLCVCLCITACKKDAEDDPLANVPATVTDLDGNLYHTLRIGTQVWLVENLKTTTYANGDPIPMVSLSGGWAGLVSGAYCNYLNSEYMAADYGRLYNFFAVSDPRGLAPAGFRVATDEDWKALIAFLGGENGAGGKLKESGTVHWITPNTEGSNGSGFTALPGGTCNLLGVFFGLGEFGYWWTSSESCSFYARSYMMYYNSCCITGSTNDKKFGFSVRCVMQ
ncbi:MAG TPA: fibrobacter succinogenes major paralogous domain-containing protein [Bacteroidales bacterium]|nr:fibrobacter succinogenes major paralogous domain-containing protein [Bacteroidales bacterium]HSA44124.1 fibrobacter succinogenes major paralogous domain-containing protein [Bacteroidales bacterium]